LLIIQMRQRPVAAGHPSLYRLPLLFKYFLVLLFFTLNFSSLVLQAQSSTVETPYLYSGSEIPNYLGRIGFNDPEQLAEALMRVEGLYLYDAAEQLTSPVSIVVHSPEVSIFQKQNYETNKSIVDLAAKLSALGVLDINVCETRLRVLGGGEESIYPFVGTVPYGPTEVNRLLEKEDYVYF